MNIPKIFQFPQSAFKIITAQPSYKYQLFPLHNNHYLHFLQVLHAVIDFLQIWQKINHF